MEPTSKYRLGLAAASLVLGAAGDFLFQDTGWGINVVIGLAALLAAAAVLGRRHGLRPPRHVVWVVLPALLAGAGFALRASPALAVLDFAALAACFLLGIYFFQTSRYGEPGILLSCKVLLETARDLLAGSAQFVRRDLPGTLRPAVAQNPLPGQAAGRGILLALPLLLVFGGLLSSADPVFAHYLAALFQWDLTALWVRCAWVVVAACLAGGCLRVLLTPAAPRQTPEETLPRFAIGRIETAIVLGALDALFFLFVLVQFRYFFGGRETVLATVGMTYAAYARHGFFELVTVAGLTLPLLLTLHAWQDWQGLDSPGQHAAPERLFRALAALLLALLFVIMASALARMNLYRSEYGLTELRVYTTAFMGWLAVVFAWFGATVLRGQRQRFALGAFVSALAALALLFLWNPDAAIVRANAALSRAGHRFDGSYALSLSADAVPELVAALPSLPPANRQAVAAGLLRRWAAPAADTPQSWCWGRWAARQAVSGSRARLLALSHGQANSRCQQTSVVAEEKCITSRSPVAEAPSPLPL